MAQNATDCLFCKIARGDIAVELVAESEGAVAFKDISPAAKHHVLVIPRAHVSSVDDCASDDHIVEVLRLARVAACELGFAETGYRLVTNAGADAGQTVFHLHVHLLGGEPLGGFGARER